jgi:hypothetical protein
MSEKESNIGKKLARMHRKELDARERGNVGSGAGEEHVPTPDEVTKEEVAEYTVPSAEEVPDHPDEAKAKSDNERSQAARSEAMSQIQKMLKKQEMLAPHEKRTTLGPNEKAPGED